MILRNPAHSGPIDFGPAQLFPEIVAHGAVEPLAKAFDMGPKDLGLVLAAPLYMDATGIGLGFLDPPGAEAARIDESKPFFHNSLANLEFLDGRAFYH